MPASNAHIGLGPPGEAGSWQRENKVRLIIWFRKKIENNFNYIYRFTNLFYFVAFYNLQGYQFWTKTDGNGSFVIKYVIFGTYNLYATVPGFIGDYKYDLDIKVSPG